jgi:ABC-type multidrug transport system fused ATPase/permease subunit
MKSIEIKPLFVYLKPYFHWVFVAIIASIANAFIDLYVAKQIQVLIDTAVKAAIHDVFRAIVMLSIAVAIGVLAKYLLKFSSGRFSVKTVRDIRNHAADKLLHLSFSDSKAAHTGTIVSKLTNNVSIVQSFLGNNLSNFFYLPMICIGTLVLMFIISWKMLLLNLFLMVLTIVIMSLQGRPLKKYSEELQSYLGGINAVAQDLIRGMSIIKAFNLEQIFFKKFNEAVDHTLDKSLQIEKRISKIIPIGYISGTLPLIVGIMMGGYLVIKGELSPGSLIINIYLLEFLSTSLIGLPQLFISLNVLSGASVELFALLNQRSEKTGGKNVCGSTTNTPIEFEGVSFSYDETAPVLNNLSFKVSKGETIALVGYSGSGKSTILKLLCGYYELGTGQIRLNGDPLSELELKSVRSLMTVVSQDVFLFPVSIRENIAYGKTSATMVEIEAAAKAANLDRLIAKLPEGYDTLVGERGVRLSGGEKQRVSIARAILKNTPIMLLDEPTSSLDKESEELILDALNNLLKERTTLIVTHRLSGIKNVSRILVLDKGVIVESGVHDSLIEGNTLYRRLYYNQVVLD